VLLLDLDDFRTVNDSLGYEAGNRVLLAVAERLENAVGSQGTVAHFGGDQFAVLLEDVTSAGDALRVAREVEEALRSPFDLEGLEGVVTASIGVGLSTSGWEPPEQIIRRADAAMYRAKEAGKARFAVYDPSANESTSP
jgi:diguanylate cyclase (GGDEF)-like protein